MVGTKYKYDIFLSYSQSDAESVEKIARYLDDRGLNVWFDRWSLVPGQLWQKALKEALESSSAIAVFVGTSPLSNWQQQEWQIGLAKKVSGTLRRIIPVLLPGSTWKSIPPALSNLDSIDLRGGLENPIALNRLVVAIKSLDQIDAITQEMTMRGDAGITAGGGVDIDNTGQLAIGKYINQFKIENPSGEALVELMDFLDRKRQGSVNVEILNSYTPSALPDYPPRLKEFVTENRVDELTKVYYNK